MAYQIKLNLPKKAATNIGNTIEITYTDIMHNPAFICGYRDKQQGLPFNRDYDRRYNKSCNYIRKNKTIHLASLQNMYERGRQFACVYTGIIYPGNPETPQVDGIAITAISALAQAMNEGTIR